MITTGLWGDGPCAGIYRFLGGRGTSNACAGAFAASITLGSARLLGAPRPTLGLVLAFVVTTFCYAIDRAVDPDPGSRRERWPVVAAGSGWLAIGVAMVALGYASAVLHSLIFPLSVLAYACPWMALRIGGRTLRRVKDVPFTKPLYVAFMWAQLAVSAALFAPTAPALLLLAITAWIFLKATVNAAACDLDDVDDDQRRGVKSWPILFGRRNTVRALHLLNGASAVLVLVPVLRGIAPLSLLWVELLSLHFAGCLAILDRGGASQRCGKLALDAGSALVLLPVAAFALRQIR